MNTSALLIWALELIAAGSVATFLIADSIPVVGHDMSNGYRPQADSDASPHGKPEQLTT